MVLGEVCMGLRQRVFPKHHPWVEGEFEYYAAGRVFAWTVKFEYLEDLRKGLTAGIELLRRT